MESSGDVAPLCRGVERILSIMLSTSELGKLDLSNIQLFQDNEDCYHNGLNDHKPLSIAQQGSFSFPLEAQDGVSTVRVQVFKTRGAIEVEKSMMEHNRVKRDKSLSMNGRRLDRLENPGAAQTKKIKKGRDDSAMYDKLRPTPPRRRAEEQQAEAEEIMGVNPGIDLKSSLASKFLMQVMPWEFQPSPLNHFTPAAVPFKWEEVPGRPKILHEPNQLPPHNNSFPILHPPPRLLMPALAAKNLPAPQSQRPKKSAGCVISSLDYKLPSPWNGDVKPAFSPFRDLGPRDDAVHSLRTKAASALIRIRRNFNPKTHRPKPNSVPLVSSHGTEEVFMDRDALRVKVNESTRTDCSPNSRFTMAMRGVDDKGFSNKTMICLWEAKDLTPIPDNDHYRNGLKLVEKRPRRKWVMRKLRRPARFFKPLFKAVWRAVSPRKSRPSKCGSINVPYESLLR
eukprot:PITA_36076